MALAALTRARHTFAESGRKIELFYDVISPYSYVGFEILCRYQKAWQADVHLRPILLGGLFKAVGNKGNYTVKAKGAYMLQDLARMNQAAGIPIHPPKDMVALFTANSIKAQRVLTAASLHAPEHLEELSRQLFKRSWSTGQNITEDDSILEACRAAQLPDELAQRLLAATGDSEVKEALKAVTTEAVEQGAFGAPTFFAGGEMFFGSDRFEMMAHRLGMDYFGPSANPYAKDIQDLLDGRGKL